MYSVRFRRHRRRLARERELDLLATHARVVLAFDEDWGRILNPEEASEADPARS
jgi:hypothetical protein